MWLLASSAPTLSGWAVLVRLLVAAGLGAAIGFERELHDREAGIRTHLLVALGSALFTMISAYGFTGFAPVRWDPTRIAAQVVTGIGFLGAGAIIREGISVRGLTTAASLWVVAGIGMGAGAGYSWPSVVATAIVVFVLWPGRILAGHLLERIRPEENRIVIELAEGKPVGPLLAELEGVRHFELVEQPDRRVVSLDLGRVDGALIGRLTDLDYVIGLRWRRS